MNKPVVDYKILYVEDDDEDLDLFNTAIKASNLPISLLQAKDENTMTKHFLKGEKPDMLLLDVHLPFFNTLDFLKDWKQNTHYRKIPLII